MSPGILVLLGLFVLCPWMAGHPQAHMAWLLGSPRSPFTIANAALVLLHSLPHLHPKKTGLLQ